MATKWSLRDRPCGEAPSSGGSRRSGVSLRSRGHAVDENADAGAGLRGAKPNGLHKTRARGGEDGEAQKKEEGSDSRMALRDISNVGGAQGGQARGVKRQRGEQASQQSKPEHEDRSVEGRPKRRKAEKAEQTQPQEQEREKAPEEQSGRKVRPRRGRTASSRGSAEPEPQCQDVTDAPASPASTVADGDADVATRAGGVAAAGQEPDRGREAKRAPSQLVPVRQPVGTAAATAPAVPCVAASAPATAAAVPAAAPPVTLPLEHIPHVSVPTTRGEVLSLLYSSGSLAGFQDDATLGEYFPDVMEYYRRMERRMRLPHQFLDRQADISCQMRAILIDWMVDVTEEYNLCSQTLFVAVNFVDRYLAKEQVTRDKLQLLGTTAMFLAAKVEEVRVRSVRDFAYLTDDAFSHDEVLAFEGPLLDALDFNICCVTAGNFLPYYLTVAKATPEATCLANYLVELSQQEYAVCGFLPSQVAASATVLALATLGLVHWSVQLERTTGYTLYTLSPCVAVLLEAFEIASANGLQAVRTKYLSDRNMCIASTRPPSRPLVLRTSGCPS